MKLSWILLIFLLMFVAVFSVQNGEPITVRFLAWDISMPGALAIQLAALVGGLVGLTAGAWSRRGRNLPDDTAPLECTDALAGQMRPAHQANVRAGRAATEPPLAEPSDSVLGR